MRKYKILLLHISDISGHRSASKAIEGALREIGKDVQAHSINAFNYTNPHLEKIVNKLYLSVIKYKPRIWDYLYDNEDILKKVSQIRALIHRMNGKKIDRLFNNFSPDIVVCTQAFPCAMVADYKHRHNLNIPLIGVLTDYSPHSYWLHDCVDSYIVPAPEVKQRLLQRGIPDQRLNVIGIPIDSKFRYQGNREKIFYKLGLDSHLPVILIMGGGQGLGPIREIARTLDKLTQSVQIVVVCGTNRSLYQWLKKHKSIFSKPLLIVGYTEQVNELMEISSFIVTKPGGLTSAEALSRSLPIIIVNPLPGQESRNTQFLIGLGVAFKVNSLSELRSQAEELLNNPVRLDKLRRRASNFAQADSALKIANFVLTTLKK